MFYFGSYKERFRGNCALFTRTSIPTIPSNIVDFNICMSVTLIIIIVIVCICFYSATFNVQDVSIIPLSDGTTNIACHFAINSSADGCYVIFTSTNTAVDNEITIFIAKDDNEDTATGIITIIDGTYRVLVYDVMDNDTNNYEEYPAINIIITHHNNY